MAKTNSLGPDDIAAAIIRLTGAISQRHPDTRNLILLGIANGGIELNRRLAAKLRIKQTGTIDISFYRDDIGRNPIPKELAPTLISSDVQGANVILVDDVLFSGRTIKAALNELFDHGRPAKVELAVLVDRDGRMLPIAADYTGLTLAAKVGEKVVVNLGDNDPASDFIRIEANGGKLKPSKKKA